MNTRQTCFGLATGISTALLGAALSSLDPVGWHLLVVGTGIGLLTLGNVLLSSRVLAVIPARARVN